MTDFITESVIFKIIIFNMELSDESKALVAIRSSI